MCFFSKTIHPKYVYNYLERMAEFPIAGTPEVKERNEKNFKVSKSGEITRKRCCVKVETKVYDTDAILYFTYDRVNKLLETNFFIKSPTKEEAERERLRKKYIKHRIHFRFGDYDTIFNWTTEYANVVDVNSASIALREFLKIWEKSEAYMEFATYNT